jgi:hypothetical protein
MRPNGSVLSLLPDACSAGHVKLVSLPIITVGEKIFEPYKPLDKEMPYAGYDERP